MKLKTLKPRPKKKKKLYTKFVLSEKKAWRLEVQKKEKRMQKRPKKS